MKGSWLVRVICQKISNNHNNNNDYDNICTVKKKKVSLKV